MARRKKTTKAKEIVTPQITPTSIGYAGKVNVKVTNHGKTVYKNTFHNNGGTKLFKFLCECLAGQYGSTEVQRPMKIKLFNTTLSIDDIKDSVAKHMNLVTTESTALTDMIYYSTSPTCKEVKGDDWEPNTNNYSVTFHFLVSYAQLNSQESINQVALYGKNETSDTNYSAVFYFINEAGELSPIVTTG